MTVSDSPDRPFLEIKNFCHTYGHKAALQNVLLAVQQSAVLVPRDENLFIQSPIEALLISENLPHAETTTATSPSIRKIELTKLLGKVA